MVSTVQTPLGETTIYKCVLLGDINTGKTSFVNRHLTGYFERKYIATMGVEVHPIVFGTNYGRIRFDVWDTVGSERIGTLRDGHYINSGCAILMFDLTNPDSYRNVNSWHESVLRVCGSIPMVLCGNKADLTKNRQVLPHQITFHRRKNLGPYYDVSSITNYHWEKPFLSLARTLTGHQDLNFTYETALLLCDSQMDKEAITQYKHQLAVANQQPIPDDDKQDLL
ncbi:GTP-binding nuclear protein GSP1/Ran [Pelomyxa schiedti]|nr:GTP-binding nuclear protein GSP1/Ran [Pelomyxa schiedti]